MDKPNPSSGIPLGILVHAAARVTYAEDERYRKQARNLSAYLTNRAQSASKALTMAISPALIKQTPLPRKVQTQHKNERNPSHFQQPSCTVAESILISVTHEASTSSGLPPIKMRAGPRTPIPKSKSPASSIVSVLGDSITEPITSTGLIENTTERPGTPSTASQVRHDTSQDSLVVPSANDTAVTPDSAGFVLRSPTYIQARKRLRSMPAEEPRKILGTAVLAERSPNVSKRRRLSDTVTEKNRSTKISSQDAAQNEPGIWLGSVAQLSNSSANASTPCPPPATSSLASAATSKTHLPPWPKTSTEQYSTNKVGVFAYIAKNTGLCTAYKPKYTIRSIEPLERGYWHLKIPYSWSTESQDDFWSLLRDMIVGGKCGWGNWIEHVDNRITKDAQPGDITSNLPQGSIDEVRFWCWGEVVREMWLAILMASRKQTMRLGMAWFDSCGKIVVQMR